MAEIYTTAEWAEARAAALLRDGSRCSLSRLFGGSCHPVLHVHHLIPVGDGGAEFDVDNLLTACQSHHPMLEAMRRYVLRKRKIPACRHVHRYRTGREECLRRRLGRAA